MIPRNVTEERQRRKECRRRRYRMCWYEQSDVAYNYLSRYWKKCALMPELRTLPNDFCCWHFTKLDELDQWRCAIIDKANPIAGDLEYCGLEMDNAFWKARMKEHRRNQRYWEDRFTREWEEECHRKGELRNAEASIEEHFNCPECGAEFIRHSNRQKYCSLKCQWKDKNNRRSEYKTLYYRRYYRSKKAQQYPLTLIVWCRHNLYKRDFTPYIHRKLNYENKHHGNRRGY